MAEFWEKLPDPPPGSRRIGERFSPPEVPQTAPVAAFARGMQRELDANTHKGARADWRALSGRELLADLNWHVIKLGAAMRCGDAAGIAEYTADIGNIAMFIADSHGLLDPWTQND